MELILIALLIVGVVAFIATPLFNPARGTVNVAPNENETLLAQRDSVYDAMRDLDFDFQLGKLSQVDYSSLRDKYKTRAAQLLKQIDELNGGLASADADSQIEAQVAQLRRTKSDAIETQVAQLRRAKTDSVEEEIARVRAARQSSQMRCGNCQTPYQAGDQFCARCGNKLS